ncbi:MAG TPA: hypothetical protein VGG64_23145 [Pirellulales bacterium]|jgi:hypothetical protein
MRLRYAIAVGLLCLSVGPVLAADDYKIAAIDQASPDEVSPDLAKLLSPKALKVTNGKRVLCEIWLRRAVPIRADFAPSQTELYPFDVGQVVGVIRFPRKTSDFRNQEIGAGVYTLRYGLQPVDGNHVGTSETRDFLLLSPAAEDKDPAKLEVDNLYKLSRDASETTHPAILPMQGAVSDFDDATAPAMVHDDSHELWSVVIKSTVSTGEQDDQKEDRLLQFVVAGHAAE